MGSVLLRAFGKEFVPDEPANIQATLKKEDFLNVRQSDVIDSFTRMHGYGPQKRRLLALTGLAHVPKTVFATE